MADDSTTPAAAAEKKGGKASKKRARPSEGGAAAGGPAVPAPQAKKHRKKKQVDESQLSAEEKERRRVQRELRDMAVKLRTDGKDYKPQKYKRKLYVTEGAGKARRERKKEKSTAKRAVRVVVLPIFWEQRSDEMQAVLDAAKKVEELLSCLGVRVVTDNNNDFKPGERMKHWETLGVPVRVEIGPQDVKKGSCVVAVAGEVGTVAKKTTVKMSEQLIKQVQKSLREAGVETTRTRPAAATEAAPDKAAATEAAAGEPAEAEEAGPSGEGAGSEEEHGEEQPSAAVTGGDDMDDFELEIDAEELALTMNKKEIAQKKRKDERAKKKLQKLVKRRGGQDVEEEEEEPGWQEQEKAKKKPSKLVVFK